jgi:RND family efflux transporter MFP subunit
MNKRFFLPALTLLLILGLFTPWYFLYLSRERAIAQLSKEMGRPPLVGVMKVHPENKETELVLPSFLDAINITPIWARTNGYLNQWLVDIGDKVKEGDLLAFIDTPDVDQEVVQAEGDLGGAIAKESIARITADRGTNLYKHNPEAIAKEEVDQMVAAHHQALADIEAAKGRLGRYKYLQGFKNLYAPFDGTIIERNIDIGSLITAGSKHSTQQIFQIAKSDILRAFVNVPQNYFHLIKDGME